MRKLFLILAAILLAASATATTITREDVTIDLKDNSIQAEIEVGELTSSDFTYTSTGKISALNASINGSSVDCSTTDLTLGTEIQCPTERKENFTVTLEYIAENLVSTEDSVKIHRYRHPVYRPTERYNLEVILPRGAALIDQENTSQQVISPSKYRTGSNGRRIFVKWNLKPRLGETLSFFILYEDLINRPEKKPGTDFLLEILAGLTALLVLTVLIIRHKRKDLSDRYDELADDQKEVLDLIEENNGEYLQKDLVQELDYSKAKISGIVSELVEMGIIKKTKEGRSNKLSISRKYRY